MSANGRSCLATARAKLRHTIARARNELPSFSNCMFRVAALSRWGWQ